MSPLYIIFRYLDRCISPYVNMIRQLYRFHLHTPNPHLPEWSHLTLVDESHNSGDFDPMDPAASSSLGHSDQFWETQILKSAKSAVPPRPSACPDSLNSFCSSLSSKFSHAQLPSTLPYSPPSQLLDYYQPLSKQILAHYIVSPLYESLNNKKSGSRRQYYYRPCHALLPYCLYEPTGPLGDPVIDMAAILAIYRSGSWAIPASLLDGWWKRILGAGQDSDTSNIFNEWCVFSTP